MNLCDKCFKFYLNCTCATRIIELSMEDLEIITQGLILLDDQIKDEYNRNWIDCTDKTLKNGHKRKVTHKSLRTIAIRTKILEAKNSVQ